MSEREAGWYWVSRGNGGWVIGVYHPSGIWRLTSSHMNYYDADFAVIGPRISEPPYPPGKREE